MRPLKPILVTVASRHGGTWGIGEVIRDTLQKHGTAAELRKPSEVHDPLQYEAIVLGSAVYAGHWLKEAREFVADHGDELRKLPVWLFSSGPIGDPAEPRSEKAISIDTILLDTEAREHELFRGIIDPKKMTPVERFITKVLRTKPGDFRDWGKVIEWSEQIAETVKTMVPSAMHRVG